MSEEVLREALAVIAYEEPAEPWRIAHNALVRTAEPCSEAMDAQGWQPIDTAPRFGVHIIGVSVPHGHLGVLMGNDQGEWELTGLYGNGLGIGFYPTHWRPLPPTPDQFTSPSAANPITHEETGRG